MKLSELKAIYGPYKKHPRYFVDYPEINRLLDAIPSLIDIAEAAERVHIWHGAPNRRAPLVYNEAIFDLGEALAALESE